MHPCKCGENRGSAKHITPLIFDDLNAGQHQYEQRKRLGLPVMTQFEKYAARGGD